MIVHRHVLPTFPDVIITLRPRLDGRHFPDDILKWIFLYENLWISIKISLKFVPREPNKQYSSFGSDNGLVPNRQQAIICTSADPIHRRIYAALGGDELALH